MDRRKSIKTIALTVIAPTFLINNNGAAGVKAPLHAAGFQEGTGNVSLIADWKEWPDMNWAGPGFWGNRLQDWRIRDGKLECVVKGRNRSLHSLTTQLGVNTGSFESSVALRIPGEADKSQDNYAGFRLGAKAIERFDDYRCAAVFGEGLDAGVTTSGNLFIGNTKSSKQIDVSGTLNLVLKAVPAGNSYRLNLSAFQTGKQTAMDEITADNVAGESLVGNLALVVHYPNEPVRQLGIDAAGLPLADTTNNDKPSSLSNKNNSPEQPSAIFADWNIGGSKTTHNVNQLYGPVCFAQYTIHKNVLKLTAQLAPVELIPGYRVELQVRNKNTWETLREGKLHEAGRAVNFRVEHWNAATSKPYRVKLELPLKSGTRAYFYEGTIAAEPMKAEKVKVAVFSCNGDHGFPDTDIAPNVGKHKPDLAVFLGDQFYEATGGFHVQTFPFEKACLDYLRKWLMFGWSYREVFRHIPCAFIPDDHDVYHGNVWGEGGKHAPTDLGFTHVAQDQGGYKMTAKWVNMVQFTQTSHLPDPYDPTPVKQGIGVYYTDWNYGGISFAILEDRKFKSAPKNVLPAEAKVQNGFMQNPDFDIKKYRDIKADLLGERQTKFLKDWASNWGEGTEMKAVLSQTNFCTVSTLPKGSISDSITPRLPIPARGEYVSGDTPNADMDSNGWPQNGRDEALRIIRKCFGFHIAGDQHIASVVHYGVDDFGDCGFAFAGPALNNIFPRRWWPTLTDQHVPLEGKAPYTGNFHDGFGNRMTVHAVANPSNTGLKPAIIQNRATGYGIVTFDKANRTIRTECWPRFVDPEQHPNGQYAGWPITIMQADNYGRKAAAWLPEIKTNRYPNPVVEITDENTGELLYALRIKGKSFKPKVFSPGRYTIKVGEPGTGKMLAKHNIAAKEMNKEVLIFDI